MKLTVLVDNNTFIDHYLLGEPAVSYFIESQGQKILFDTGYSDAFLINAQRLGIGLEDLDIVVLSHGHNDHTGGLSHLVRFLAERKASGVITKKPVLVAHPDTFLSRSYNNESEIGSILKENSLSTFFELRLSQEPLALNSKLTFLGQIARTNTYEAMQSIGLITQRNGENIPDMVMDDSALVYRADQGLVIITGCSHAGVCNIIEYAKEITGESNIRDVIGGLHLQNPENNQIQQTVVYFTKNQPAELHACHCTDLQSKIMLASVANIKEVGCGMVLEY